MIRFIEQKDFEQFYQIWKEGLGISLSPGFDYKLGDSFYQDFFEKSIENQNRNFRIWGYFEESELLGWQSLLSCQSSPILYNSFAQSSTYIREIGRKKGLAAQLLTAAINYARQESELSYILAYIGNEHLSAQKIAAIFSFTRIGALPTTKNHKNLPEFSIWALEL